MIFWLRGKRKADYWHVLCNVPLNIRKSCPLLLMDVISNIHDSAAFQSNKINDLVRELLISVIHISIDLFYEFRS